MLTLYNENAENVENAQPDLEHFLDNQNVKLNDPFKKKDQQPFQLNDPFKKKDDKPFQLNDPFKKKDDKPFQLNDPFKKKADQATQEKDTLKKIYDKPTETSIKETIIEVGPPPVRKAADQHVQLNDPFRKKSVYKHEKSASKHESSFREGMIQEEPEVFSPAPVSSVPVSPAIDHTKFSAEDKGHRVWSIVHETSFARTFTEIAEELDKIIAFSKFILGEDRLN